MNAIDLNADLGEGGAHDLELLQIVSSASIACGGHAGDEQTMADTLTAAKTAGVVTGAHPGFLDRKNFGRLRLNISAEKVARQVVEQVKTIAEIGAQVAQTVSYVKLHGALYNWASEDEEVAKTIFLAVKDFNPKLHILALDNSAQLVAAKKIGLETIAEAFADRWYLPNGQLTPRSESGAVITFEKIAVAQALKIARDKEVVAQDGSVVSLDAQSLCLHGDNVAALKLARGIRQGLAKAGIAIQAAI